jgi:bis(5'-adenosyl)-triphosphatase
MPGHVLVIPYRQVKRLTDLTNAEVTDIFTTVQKIQRMLATVYFTTSCTTPNPAPSQVLETGSFNVALQDGPESGQTVPHVHCHIIPRTPESSKVGDAIYDRLQSEEGNVGGGLWDLAKVERPVPVGKFPAIEESERENRSEEVMNREASFYRAQMALLDGESIS